MNVLEKARRFANNCKDTKTKEMIFDLTSEIEALNKKCERLEVLGYNAVGFALEETGNDLPYVAEYMITTEEELEKFGLI